MDVKMDINNLHSYCLARRRQAARGEMSKDNCSSSYSSSTIDIILLYNWNNEKDDIDLIVKNK
jgi:hypothetical protein